MILHSLPPSIALPAAGGLACSRQRFRFGLCCTHCGQQGLRRSPAATTSVVQLPPSRSSVHGTASVEPTGPIASASTSPGFPAPQTMTHSLDRISTRTRRRSATAAGKARPAVDYGCGSGRPPRPSSRRVKSTRRVRRPRPVPPAAGTHTLTDPPVHTVPLPSDYDHAEPIGTPLFWLTSSPGDTSTKPTRSDALDDAAELRFADSIASSSNDD